MNTTSKIRYASQFPRFPVRYTEPFIGFDAYVAVWANGGREVVIGAPTLAALALRWKEITLTDLNRDRAQHVVMTSVTAEFVEQAKAARTNGSNKHD